VELYRVEGVASLDFFEILNIAIFNIPNLSFFFIMFASHSFLNPHPTPTYVPKILIPMKNNKTLNLLIKSKKIYLIYSILNKLVKSCFIFFPTLKK
jgi:hypothetical protein